MNDNYRTGRPSLTKQERDDIHVQLWQARAQKESALADLAELRWRDESARYVARHDVIEASAIALALISDRLSAIPVTASDRLCLSPEIVKEIGSLIDEGLADLSTAMDSICRQSEFPTTTKE